MIFGQLLNPESLIIKFRGLKAMNFEEIVTMTFLNPADICLTENHFRTQKQ